jgi:hypothetical protein
VRLDVFQPSVTALEHVGRGPYGLCSLFVLAGWATERVNRVNPRAWWVGRGRLLGALQEFAQLLIGDLCAHLGSLVPVLPERNRTVA